MGVYSSAYDRMVEHLKIENNQLTWDFKDAVELNISQNIYDYVIFMWNRCNTKLSSGNYILETDGIYFQLKSKNSGIMPLTAQILFRGQHSYNMRICAQLVRNARTGWLGNYIDLEHSEMGPDGWGAYFIKGRGDDGLGRPWSYIAYNVCPNSPHCDLNYINASDAYETAGTFYEKVMNSQWAPLVTVTNADYVAY